MKHAGTTALHQLEDLLRALRQFADLKEPRRGTFYRRSSAVLHFHEDPAGLFADLKLGDDFQRFPVNSRSERAAVVAHVAALCGAAQQRDDARKAAKARSAKAHK